MSWIKWGQEVESHVPAHLPPKGSLLFRKMTDFVSTYCRYQVPQLLQISHYTEIILPSTSLNINNSGRESH